MSKPKPTLAEILETVGTPKLINQSLLQAISDALDDVIGPIHRVSEQGSTGTIKRKLVFRIRREQLERKATFIGELKQLEGE